MSLIKIKQPTIEKNLYQNFWNQYVKKKNDGEWMDILYKTENPKYLHFEKLRFKTPKDYNEKDFWTAIKVHRDSKKQIFPKIKDKNGNPFYWIKLDRFDSILRELDSSKESYWQSSFESGTSKWKSLSKKTFFEKNIENLEKNSESLLKNSLIEEAIASAQLEGAHTTRRIAKKMILEEQKPANNSERMVMNNYKAINFIGENFTRGDDLSSNVFFDLHSILMEGDIDIEKNKIGAFREDKDEIVVGNGKLTDYVYEAPKMEFVKKQMEELCNFANDCSTKDFIHPIIKAIILHFWFGYLHPFVDGNGRIARCIFYWSLMQDNYDFMAYYPISTMIKKSPKQYSDSYIYTEQDDNDLTYFIDYNLNKIKEAKDSFELYFERKIKEQNQITEIAEKKDLNDRQEQLLKDINLNRFNYITPTSYMNLYSISKPTAIKELKELEAKKILEIKKVGKEVRYYEKDDK